VAKTSHAVDSIVALQTGGAILIPVFLDKSRIGIILLMAEAALLGLESEDIYQVACPASDRLTAVVYLVVHQAEISLQVMVERFALYCRWDPRLCVVAHVATLCEDAGMHLGLLVAGCALARGLAKNLQNLFTIYSLLAG